MDCVAEEERELEFVSYTTFIYNQGTRERTARKENLNKHRNAIKCINKCMTQVQTFSSLWFYWPEWVLKVKSLHI